MRTRQVREDARGGCGAAVNLLGVYGQVGYRMMNRIKEGGGRLWPPSRPLAAAVVVITAF